MAIIKLGPDNFQLFTLATHPVRQFSSASWGITGSVNVYARQSRSDKGEAQSQTAFDEGKFEADSLEDLRISALAASKVPTKAYAEVVFAISSGEGPADGDYIGVTGSDGKAYVFEFDTDSSYDANNTQVDINGLSDAADIASVFHTAFKSVSGIEVKSKIKDNATDTVVLTQKTGGNAGNTSIITGSASPASSLQNTTVPSIFIGGTDAGDLKNPLKLYMSGVNAEPVSSRKQKAMELFRFETSFKYTKDTGRKNVIRNILMPYHRRTNPWSHYAFTNYHTLNFFTASWIPTGSALIYPNYFKDDTSLGPYSPESGFTISFYVNPNRTMLKRTDPYRAGTIMHLSSSYAVSLVTGTLKNEHGLSSGFRILLQLSRSADVSPSQVAYTSTSAKGTVGGNSLYPNDLVFLSKDNSLKLNRWHHVAIRWGSNVFNAGTGSIMIDSNESSRFVVPSASIAPINKTGKTLASASFQFEGKPEDGAQITLVDSNGVTEIFEFDAAGTASFVTSSAGVPSGSVRVKIKASDTVPNVAETFRRAVTNSVIDISGSLTGAAGAIVVLKQVTGGAGGNTEFTTGSQTFRASGDIPNLTASYASGGALTFAGGTNATTASIADPQGLFIGNFWEGTNQMSTGSNMVQFFNPNSNDNEGVRSLGSENWDPDSAQYTLRHPLDAEIHDIRIYSEYRSDNQIMTSSMKGPETLDKLLFYLPLFFVKESRKRNTLLTPFQTIQSETNDPFNVSLSFGVGGHLLNAENYLREFIQKEYPRCLHLTASVVEGDAQIELTMNQYLYSTGSVMARNLLLLPCDNGKFVPNFDLLKSGTYDYTPKNTHEMGAFVNDVGQLNLQFVSLNDLILTSSLINSMTKEEGDMESDIMGSSPEDPGTAPGVVLTVFQRTRDNTSNQVVFFDMSNLFYGRRIKPGSLVLKDTGLTGSVGPTATGVKSLVGRVPMEIRDNGYGNLYRADANTEHATWSSVGNIYYDEGIIVIKSPNIPLFGIDHHDVYFKGEHDIHVLKMLIPCEAGKINSSSNPAYVNVSASFDANDCDNRFIYITGINFHDDNFNVIAKTTFAQPVVKRSSDKYFFKPKIDF